MVALELDERVRIVSEWAETDVRGDGLVPFAIEHERARNFDLYGELALFAK
jgi:hypothetical protein